MAFIFYDVETTGKITSFDQILQFAAIKVDDNLDESDRYEVRCRLLPYVVPSPKALQMTGVAPEMITEPGLPSHYEAMKQIRAKLTEWSPAIFIGFNSIEFDEELLRRAFFQTLHPVYLTNTDGNARADVMRIVQAASVYAPDCILVPRGNRGWNVFRLDQLAPFNGYIHKEAHEATADVEATIFIARKVKEQAPDVWQAMMRSARKDSVIDFLTDEKIVSLSECYYGCSYSWLTTYCGVNPDRDSQLAAFDLANNPEDYLDLSVEQLIDVLNDSPKVIRTIRGNKQPILMPADKASDSAKTIQVPYDELQRRVELIRSNPKFQLRVGQALKGRYPAWESSLYVEDRIYDGFPDATDEELMRQFHQVKWDERPALVKHFEDERLKELARRLIYVEQPDLLSDQERVELDAWAAERVASDDPNVPWTTVPKALREVDALLADASGKQAEFLEDAKTFIEGLADHLNIEQR